MPTPQQQMSKRFAGAGTLAQFAQSQAARVANLELWRAIADARIEALEKRVEELEAELAWPAPNKSP